MTSTRNTRSSLPLGSPDVYHTSRTWASTYQQPSKYVGDIFPCTIHPRRFRISWSTVSVLEILLLLFVIVVYLALSERTLLKMLHDKNKKQVNELNEWLIRLYGSSITMQVTLLICGISFGEEKTRKAIYCGLLSGNVLSVAMYAAFVHSMSEWNVVNIVYVAALSTFSLFRIIVLVLNPVWWVWKVAALT